MKLLLILCYVVSLHNTSAEQGYFWHLTDFHLDASYWANPRNARNASEFFPNGSYDMTKCWLEGGGLFGDYNCDAPLALIQSAIKFVQNESASLPNNTFVIWTGDDTVHSNDIHFSEEIVMEMIIRNTEAIKPLFSEDNMKIFPVLGNHDAFPKSQFPSNHSADDLYEQVADVWKDFLQPVNAYDSFKTKGGYYFVNKTISRLPFHLIGLNTNIYYRSNGLVGEDEKDPLQQFSWLTNLLAEMKFKNEKVLMFAHISPGKFERYYEQSGKDEVYSGFHWFRPDFNEKFIDEVILPFNDTIIAQFYGHHHTDTFKLFNDGDRIVSNAFLTPAITPWRSTLSVETGSNNPSVRLVKYDTTSGEILDIIQYWLNLKEANAKGEADWSKLYTFTSYYGIEDLRVASLEKLARTLQPGVNDTMFLKYYQANSVNYDEYLEYNCTESCQRTQYCSIMKQRYNEFEDCYRTVSAADKFVSNKIALSVVALSFLFQKMI